MADIKNDIDTEIKHVSEAWAEKFLSQRRGILERRKIKATGSLSDSLEYEVVKDAAEAAVRVLIAFNEEGRIAEMRRYRYAHDKWGRNAVTRMEDWIKARGLAKFVPGFMARHPRYKNVPKDVVNYIAWSIMVSRSGGRFRRRPWWNKAKTAAVDDLYNQVAVAALDEAADGIIQNLSFFEQYSMSKGRSGPPPKKKKF